ncbi:uncharacterized protein [Linepithema humile]|uniref:uncharacterized protein n=1 Tax=Linepithema humile TaxID=83485 RepID=UPI00351ED23C
MDKLAEFAGDMQKFLLRKEKEFGELKFVSSRATEDTSCFINELMQTVVNIFEKYNIPKEFSDNEQKTKGSISTIPIVAQCYNYLLLNTHFSSQELLTEDISCGHMVDVWPALSPYLFIQIIWRLKYDEVLVESLQHIPLDLCVDVLQITIKCINELEAERAISLTFSLMKRIYCKCLSLHLGTISAEDVMKCTNQLVASFQMLLDLIGKFANFPDMPEEKKYEQHGILLKRILRHIKLYMCEKKKAYTTDPDFDSSTNPYKLTYGDPDSCPNYKHTLSIDEVNLLVTRIDQELITLLLNQIKQVDCFEYMGWAEVDDVENNVITLQRAIIIECYHFMKFMKEDEFLMENDHLSQCLQQLIGSESSENLEKSILTLQELCHDIANGRPEDMKELLKRYKEWDQSTLSFINEKMHLLEKNDSFFLLEYLDHIFGNPSHSKERKHQAYASILKIMLQLSAVNMYFIVLKYTNQHFQDNHLEHLYSQKHFEAFVSRNESMREPVRMRTLLIFALLNTKKVLTTLVKIVIGYTEYKDIIFTPYDMLLLRPFLCIKADSQCSLLAAILKEVCVHNSNWNSKNFTEFIKIMLENQAIKPDDLMNNIYIPYLVDTSFQDNLSSILALVYDTLTEKDCVHKINYTLLITALAKKMSLIRKCHPDYTRSIVNSVVTNIMRIIFFPFHARNLLTASQRCEVQNTISDYLEPIDRIQLWRDAHYMPELIRDYKRRCFIIRRRLCSDSQSSPELREYAQSIQLNQDAFIMHMMLHATEEEFKRFALELTTVFWCHFGWVNEFEAYKNVLRITSEAAHLALTFDETFPSDSFVVLLRALVSFCGVFANIKDVRDQEMICCCLQKTLFLLKEAANKTRYGQTYSLLLARVKDISVDESYSDVENYFHEISEWIEMYLVQCETLLSAQKELLSSTLDNRMDSCEENSRLVNDNCISDKLNNLFEAYKFICACINMPSKETYRCIERIRDIFGE